MTRIKIDGIKEESHAAAIARAGVDYMGLIFAPSPRQVTPKQAMKIIEVLRDAGTVTQAVGVFVNTKASAVNHTAESCKLDWVQLSGDEPWGYCRELARPVIKVIRVSKLCIKLLVAMISMAKSQSQLRKGLNPSLAYP